jgi:hypothetical protein
MQGHSRLWQNAFDPHPPNSRKLRCIIARTYKCVRVSACVLEFNRAGDGTFLSPDERRQFYADWQRDMSVLSLSLHCSLVPDMVER